MIGSLMYLTASRPDIMFAVCIYARHQVTPKECHLHAVKRIFRYLKGHPLLGLWYPKESLFDLVAYSDSDYDGDNHDRKSTTRGYDNVADLLTKPFDVGRFQYLVVEHALKRYALEVHPTIYVSHIRQFWSTARIETADGETKIIATIDGKQRTTIESSIRRDLQLNDEEGISTFPNNELFENLSLMGYNISENQKFSFQKGQFTHQWKFLIHTIMQCLSPKSTGFNEFSSNIVVAIATQTTPPASLPQTTPSQTPTLRRLTRRAIQIAQSKSLSPGADEHASLPRDERHGEAFPTATSLNAGQDRENIGKTSAIPCGSPPRVTSLGDDEGSMQQKLQELMEFCTTLQSQHSQMAKHIHSQDLEISLLKQRIKTLEDVQGINRNDQEDAPNRGGDDLRVSGEDIAGKEASKSTEKGSESTGEMANILSTMKAANILASGGLKNVVTTVCPHVSPASVAVATASETIAPAVATATTKGVTLYSRRTRASRGVILESSQPSQTTSTTTFKSKGKEKVLEPEPELTSKKSLQEQMSKQAARRLEQEFALEDQAIREQVTRDAVIARIQAEETLSVQNFTPMDTKEESERFKRPGIQLVQRSSKRLKSAAKPSRSDLSDKELQKMVKIVPVKEVYVEALQVKRPIIGWYIYDDGKMESWKIVRVGEFVELYQTFENMLKRIDREDLDKLWSLAQEGLKRFIKEDRF
ncbi:hypothetical protein Tco_0379300 [Tanacetum coccineum]